MVVDVVVEDAGVVVVEEELVNATNVPNPPASTRATRGRVKGRATV
jgi:hypothetical protein